MGRSLEDVEGKWLCVAGALSKGGVLGALLTKPAKEGANWQTNSQL